MKIQYCRRSPGQDGYISGGQLLFREAVARSGRSKTSIMTRVRQAELEQSQRSAQGR